MVDSGSCAINLLDHSDGGAAAGHVLVVELGRVAVDVGAVVGNLSLECLGRLVAGDRHGNLDIAVVGPAIAQVRGLMDRELVRANLVEGKLAEDRLGLVVETLDGDLVTKLLAVLVEQREGELP